MAQLLDPPMLVRSASPRGFLRTNPAFLELAGFSEQELAADSILDWLVPEDRAALEAALAAGEGLVHARHRTQGAPHLLELRVSSNAAGPVVLARALAPAEAGAQDDHTPTEATVTGTLETIAHVVEEEHPGLRCSILLVQDGRFVRGAGPSLPDAYNAAIDGYAVGPFVGSCGTAIHWGVPVIATNLQTDPLWTDFRDLARKAGVHACWSHPFTSRGGAVLGALALYSSTPGAPTPAQLTRLRAAARMTGLAVERGRAEEELRAKRQRELELEDQLRAAAKMEALGVLAGGVAHDFNNILSSILTNAEFALEVQSGQPEVAEMLREIAEVTKRAGGFCQQMLSYAGEGSVEKERIEVGSLLPQLSNLVHAALSKKVRLQYCMLDTPIYVEGDENQLLQVIMNLVTNAAEAIGDHEGTIVVASELAVVEAGRLPQLAHEPHLPGGEYVKLIVRDTGSGMDVATISRIFDPFFTTKFTGRGLGLAAARGVVAKHNGAIELQSTPGEGTTFTVWLPTIVGPALTLAPAQELAAPSAPGRILVVDDEARLRAGLCRLLKYKGYETVQAADGQEGIDRFREDPGGFDCILLDLSMPKLNGEEVYRELVAIWPDVPVILMSGHAEESVMSRFGQSSLAGVLQKPVSTDELLEAIREAMS
jgi:signal transduction histidine kinase